jgi:hypothetical protein
MQRHGHCCHVISVPPLVLVFALALELAPALALALALVLVLVLVRVRVRVRVPTGEEMRGWMVCVGGCRCPDFRGGATLVSSLSN